MSCFFFYKILLETGSWCSFLLLRVPFPSSSLIPVVPVVGLDTGGSFLVLPEPLVLAVVPVVLLDHASSGSHLLPVAILQHYVGRT